MSYLIYNQKFTESELYRSRNYKNSAEIIDHFIQNGKITEIVLIVPTNRVARYLKQQILQKYFEIHHKPLRKLHIYNLQNFIEENFDEVSKNKTITQNYPNFFKQNSRKNYILISEASRVVLTEEAYQKADLQYYKFSNIKVKLEVIKKLSELIYGLREDGFNSSNILHDKESEFEKQYEIIDERKNADTISLILEYEKLLTDGLFDIPKIYELVNILFSNEKTSEVRDNIITSRFGLNTEIITIGFSELKMPEFEFISHFSKSKFPFSISLDYSDANGPLFGNFQETINKLDEVGFNIYSDDELFDDFEQKNNDTDSYFLRKFLFNYNSEKINKNFEDYIKIVQTTNIDQEVKSIAKLVKYLNLEKNIKLNEIAIVSKDANDYANAFRDIFKRERIPVNISDRINLMSANIINILVNLIQLKAEFDIEMIINVLSSQFVKIDSELDLNNILEITNQLRISKFYYKHNSKYIINKAKNYLSFVSNKLLEELDYHDKKKYSLLKTKLEKYIEDFQIIQQKFPQIHEEFSSKRFKEFIYKIISEYKVKDAVLSKQKEFISLMKLDTVYDYYFGIEELEKENQAISKFLLLLDEISLTFDMRFGDKNFTLNEWLMRLKIAVSQERFQIPEKNNYGVQITSIEQIRMISYKVKILCGLNDGVFPSIYSGEKIIGRELKESRLRHIRSERISFYQFLSSSNHIFPEDTQLIYLFFNSKKNSENLSPSPFVENLFKISNLKSTKTFYSDSNLGEEEQIIEEFSWMNSLTKQSEILELTLSNKIIENISELSYKLIEYKSRLNQDEVEYLRKIDSKETINSKIELTDEFVDEFHRKYFSISDIEKYASCPYQYYVKKILSFEAPEKIEESLAQFEKGNFAHNLFYKFYIRLLSDLDETFTLNLKKEDGGDYPVTVVRLEPVRRDKYEKLLLEIIEEELKNPIFDHPFIHLEFDDFLSKDINQNFFLYWLNEELRRAAPFWEFYPYAFEYTLMRKLELKNEEGGTEDTMNFLMKVDKAIIRSDGENNTLGVIDYKYSKGSVEVNNSITSKKKSFQMPIYLKLLMDEFREKGVLVTPLFGAYNVIVRTYDNSNSNLNFVLLEDDSIRELFGIKKNATSQVLKNLSTEKAIENSVSEVFVIKEKILGGNFPLSDDIPKACKYCDFDSLCKRRSN